MGIRTEALVPVEAQASEPPEEAGEDRRPRRMGRPRGPVRIPLTVRILAAHDRRLTAEVSLQGLSPQYLVEHALSEYFERLDRLRTLDDSTPRSPLVS